MRNYKTFCRHIGIVLCLIIYGTAPAQASTELERKVKAAFVYNFAKFVDWPPADSAGDNQFVICLSGSTDLGEVIRENLENKPIRNRNIQVRDIGVSVDQLNGCQMLYLNGSNSPNVGRLLNAAAKKPILTVGESETFSAQGGIIQFLLVDNKIRFTINQAAASSAGLSISAKLLEVSYKVINNQSALEHKKQVRRHGLLS